MRTCMYCGRELEKGEKCTCAQSVARRGGAGASQKEDNTSKKTDTSGATYSDPYRTNTSYKTGYAGGESRFERAKNRYRARRSARANTKTNTNMNGFGRRIWERIAAAIKTPVEAVTNAPHLGKAAMLGISAVTGALLWLCIFFILSGGAIGPLGMVSAAMGFGKGHGILRAILSVMLSGAVGGVVIFFVYTGIFYFINRFMMRMRTPYWSFCERLVSAWIPFAVICLIGTLFGMLSPYTLIALILCGAVSAAVLTYEALKTEWYAIAPSKIVYAMVLGYFVFLSIMLHLMRI